MVGSTQLSGNMVTSQGSQGFVSGGNYAQMSGSTTQVVSGGNYAQMSGSTNRVVSSGNYAPLPGSTNRVVGGGNYAQMSGNTTQVVSGGNAVGQSFTRSGNFGQQQSFLTSQGGYEDWSYSVSRV